MAPMILGYWDIRGLATPIRLLLEYVGADYQEKLYKCGPPPNFERPEWVSEKFNLGMPFPNLPYLIDGDIKISQSSVILRYLARKFGLMGKDEVDQINLELIAAQVTDYHMDFVKIVYNPEFPKLKDSYVSGLPDKMKALTNFMGDKKFVVGDYVTYADFMFFEYLEGQSYLVKDLLKDYPVLDQYHKRILGLEAVDKYFKSPKAIKYPFNGAPAYFGGAYSDQLMAKQ